MNSGVAVVLHSTKECVDSLRLGFWEDVNEKESLFMLSISMCCFCCEATTTTVLVIGCDNVSVSACKMRVNVVLVM